MLRVEMLDESDVVVDTFSVKLPKVKVTGKLIDGTPIYDSPIYISIDGHPKKPVSFQYRTVNLLKSSAMATGKMDGAFEDLRMFV